MCTFLILLFNYHTFILIFSSKNLVIHCETTKYPLTDDLLYSHCLLLTLYGYSNEKSVVDHCCPVFKDWYHWFAQECLFRCQWPIKQFCFVFHRSQELFQVVKKCLTLWYFLINMLALNNQTMSKFRSMFVESSLVNKWIKEVKYFSSKNYSLARVLLPFVAHNIIIIFFSDQAANGKPVKPKKVLLFNFNGRLDYILFGKQFIISAKLVLMASS